MRDSVTGPANATGGETVSAGMAVGLTAAPLVRRYLSGRKADAVARAIDSVVGLEAAAQIYQRTKKSMQETGKSFSDAAMESMEIAVRVNKLDVERIPKTGPLVVVANHPFGGVEGIVLTSLLGRVRPDVKLLANEMLDVFVELRPQLIGLDVFGGEKAARANAAGMREAMKHLKDGGCLVVFPAGEVSHFRGREMGVADSDWQPGVGMLVRRSKATVLPVYVPGGNGFLFNALGLIHPRLRTALLPRCLLAQRGTSMEIRVGGAITAKRLSEKCAAQEKKAAATAGGKGFDEDAEVMRYLRQRVYMLRYRTERPEGEEASREAEKTVLLTSVGGDPIIAETPTADLERDLAGLPEEALLVPGAEYEAYVARPRQIPHVLREIGRLREVTFRAVGEGTGKPTDLDDYDNHYLHLFVWSKRDKRVVGAYRLGRVDLILRALGKKGLYTSTLFDYPESLVRNLGGALEMGRSFVRAEYQRSHQPLLMLWKGIGAFVVKNPRYYTLFGPVSISAAYATMSRQLMVQFLSMNGLRAEGAEKVKARAPFKLRRYQGVDAEALLKLMRDSDDVSELVGELEPDAKGVPVLLHQYLKLGARVLSFNVDHDFGGCLDALVTVDLRGGDPKLMLRYMGKEGAEEFCRRHGIEHVLAK